MKLMKSLLLGSAAGVVAVASAQAADLPTKKGAPAAQYVQVCNIAGVTGFTIPGSDTCLKISGELEAIYTVGTTAGSSQSTQNALGFFSRGEFVFTLANNTAMGPLTSEFRFNGNYGNGFDGSSGFGLDHAWIKWAGITAGYQQSFFSGYLSGSLETWDDMIGTDVTHGVLAYTASFGGGFSATLSLEANDTLLGSGAGYGTRAPDIAGSLDVVQGWGKAHLGVIAHNVETLTVGTAGSTNTWGYGVLGALEVNIPGMAGSKIDAQAVYTRDATGYSGLTSYGSFNLKASPTYVDVTPTATGWASSQAWSANVGVKLAVSPTFNIIPEVSYGQITYGSGAGIANSSMFVGGGTLEWLPIKNLGVDLDLIYAAGTINALGTTPSQNINGFNGKLHIFRSF